MKEIPGLQQKEIELIQGVFKNHPEVSSAKIFGSRAKGTHQQNSDVDLALWGELDLLKAESIASDLDELPLPYLFDVKKFDQIRLAALRDHILRVGIEIYP